jgi:hypothetical protein
MAARSFGPRHTCMLPNRSARLARRARIVENEGLSPVGQAVASGVERFCHEAGRRVRVGEIEGVGVGLAREVREFFHVIVKARLGSSRAYALRRG